MKPFEADGKKLFARTCTANEWFDAGDHETERDQDYALIAVCIVDEKENPVYTIEEIGELDVVTYHKLFAETKRANLPEEPEKK